MQNVKMIMLRPNACGEGEAGKRADFLFPRRQELKPEGRKKGRIGVGPLWLFQCDGIWIRIIRKSEPGERARIWRVRQVRTFLW